MGRGIGALGCALAALIAAALFAETVAGQQPSPVHAQAVERFRAAAVLQERALYDLAAAEYAAIERDLARDPLADRARLERGVCLFHLQRFADAAEALGPLRLGAESLTPAEAEQSLAYFGLANYNLSLAADHAGQAGLLDAAIESLACQMRQFPTGELASPSSYYYAEALYARGRLDDAVAAYRILLARYPSHVNRGDALYALGVAEHERKAFEAAIEAFKDFEAAYSQYPLCGEARMRRGDALLALSESLLARGNDESAARTVDELLRDFPESALVPPALMLKAQIELKRAELEAAESTLDQCIARSTHADVSGQARLLRAQVRYRRGNFAGTFTDATSVLAADKQQLEALHLRGLAEAGLSRPLDAVKSFKQRLAKDPTYPRADHVLYDLAWAYQAANRPDDATAAFGRLAATYPHSQYAAECHFRVGEAKYAAKDFDAAAKCFADACDAKPAPDLLLRALHKRAWCSFERGDYAAAESTFARQVTAQQGQVEALAADALHMIAECRYQQRHYDRTLAAFDAAAPHTSANESLRAMTCVHAAQAAAEIQNWPRAFELADRAVREFPAGDWQDEARCEKGVALVELGRLEEAERDLAAIAAKRQGLLQLKSQLALARILRARRDDDAAVRAFFKVAYGHGGPAAPAAYHPLQAEAIYAAAQLLEDTGRQDAAGKLYQELVDHYPASAHSQLARQSIELILKR
jgi:cellulose synthase operon protein C